MGPNWTWDKSCLADNPVALCLRPYQLGVQFIQIGNDEEATAFLIELDDDLKAEAGVRDIVRNMS